jgi:hypothetical protein
VKKPCGPERFLANCSVAARLPFVDQSPHWGRAWEPDHRFFSLRLPARLYKFWERIASTMASRNRPRRKAPLGWKWIFPLEFRHWRSKKMVRRKDGKRFAFLVRAK